MNTKNRNLTTETERALLGLQPLTTTAYSLRVPRHREIQKRKTERTFCNAWVRFSSVSLCLCGERL